MADDMFTPLVNPYGGYENNSSEAPEEGVSYEEPTPETETEVVEEVDEPTQENDDEESDSAPARSTRQKNKVGTVLVRNIIEKYEKVKSFDDSTREIMRTILGIRGANSDSIERMVSTLMDKEATKQAEVAFGEALEALDMDEFKFAVTFGSDRKARKALWDIASAIDPETAHEVTGGKRFPVNAPFDEVRYVYEIQMKSPIYRDKLMELMELIK